ncbi:MULTISPECIES: cell wall hydrolase [Coprobacillaceae]|uniref:cell wall hydrolase n=1 Tax=Coprobacillaceae TaxID=2810280 RepID=UPI000E51E0AD|nr:MULTISPECIES: cell wall hydrolase [Coprobacillaceae]RHM61488.1 cell wall hydrolase [Coprobacillus sp. AF33-1AC]RHS93967.1 cell wall hydrolase [Erysipelatoclostridium sp. AM42-17]
MTQRIAYNPKEVDLLARLIKSEALSEGDLGMLLVGNVVINRVVAICDVFRQVTSITEAVYQKNAFAGVGTPLFNSGVNDKEKELALRTITSFRQQPAQNALWFKNPGTNVSCPPTFYGTLSGRYKNHCFYNPQSNLNCEL